MSVCSLNYAGREGGRPSLQKKTFLKCLLCHVCFSQQDKAAEDLTCANKNAHAYSNIHHHLCQRVLTSSDIFAFELPASWQSAHFLKAIQIEVGRGRFQLYVQKKKMRAPPPTATFQKRGLNDLLSCWSTVITYTGIWMLQPRHLVSQESPYTPCIETFTQSVWTHVYQLYIKVSILSHRAPHSCSIFFKFCVDTQQNRARPHIHLLTSIHKRVSH